MLKEAISRPQAAKILGITVEQIKRLEADNIIKKSVFKKHFIRTKDVLSLKNRMNQPKKQIKYNPNAFIESKKEVENG